MYHRSRNNLVNGNKYKTVRSIGFKRAVINSLTVKINQT